MVKACYDYGYGNFILSENTKRFGCHKQIFSVVLNPVCITKNKEKSAGAIFEKQFERRDMRCTVIHRLVKKVQVGLYDR